jgi:hypothetical protein
MEPFFQKKADRLGAKVEWILFLYDGALQRDTMLLAKMPFVKMP